MSHVPVESYLTAAGPEGRHPAAGSGAKPTGVSTPRVFQGEVALALESSKALFPQDGLGFRPSASARLNLGVARSLGYSRYEKREMVGVAVSG